MEIELLLWAGKINFSIINTVRMQQMKITTHSIYSIILMVGLNTIHVSAQDNLNISSDLKANSMPLKIKRKGISAIGKYQFDGYKIISGKAGWTTTKSTTSFKSESKTESKNKQSFVFVNQVNDSVIVNTAINSEAEILVDSIINIWVGNTIAIEAKNNFFNRTFFKWDGHTLKKGSERFVANFLFLKDNNTWNLSMISPISVEVDGEYKMDPSTEFEALLSDGNQDIVIKQIGQIENTKISLIRGPAFGYEFYLDGHPIAALQYMPIDRMFIWFHNDLNENLKFVIASASTALLVKTF